MPTLYAAYGTKGQDGPHVVLSFPILKSSTAFTLGNYH